MKIDDIKRIVDYTKARLEDLAQPNVWVACTKDMGSGELKAFKQSCIDDEVIIKALEKQIPKKLRVKVDNRHGVLNLFYFCPNCNSFRMESRKYCSNCGQALDWKETYREFGLKEAEEAWKRSENE